MTTSFYVVNSHNLPMLKETQTKRLVCPAYEDIERENGKTKYRDIFSDTEANRFISVQLQRVTY